MFIVQEIQTNNGASTLLPAITKTDKGEAESAFYTILASAAISSVEVHTALMYDEHGDVIHRAFYEHIEEPEDPEEA